MPPTRGFAAALRSAATELHVITEIKRRSPSKGDLQRRPRPGRRWPREYAARAARRASVGADRRRVLRRLGRRPAGGARGVLAAGAAQGLHRLRARRVRRPADGRRLRAADRRRARAAPSWSSCTRWPASVGLDVLVEIHDEAELEVALAAGADLIGVNQRDLVTFEVDHERAVRMAGLIPDGVVKVAESGVRGRADAAVAARRRLPRRAGRRDAGDGRRSRPQPSANSAASTESRQVPSRPHVREDLRYHQRGRRPARGGDGRRRGRVRLRPVDAAGRRAAGLRHHPPPAARDPDRRRVPRRASRAGHRHRQPRRAEGRAAARPRDARRWSPRSPPGALGHQGRRRRHARRAPTPTSSAPT